MDNHSRYFSGSIKSYYKVVKGHILKVKYILTNIVLSILSVFMLVSVLVLLYWHLKDYRVIDWQIAHYEMQKESYKVGEPLTFRTAFCKSGDYEAKLIYQVEDGVVYGMPIRISGSSEGCRDFIDGTLITPNIPEGNYRLKGIITYRVNPVKEVTYIMYSNTFRIEK